jgi:hypothetical protein
LGTYPTSVPYRVNPAASDPKVKYLFQTERSKDLSEIARKRIKNIPNYNVKHDHNPGDHTKKGQTLTSKVHT